jgi:hypothetical protein
LPALLLPFFFLYDMRAQNIERAKKIKGEPLAQPLWQILRGETP